MDSRSLIRSSSSRRAPTTIRLKFTAHSLTAPSMPGECAPQGEDVGGEAVQIGIAEARSALAWWLDAGVDTLVQDEPRDWLKSAPTKTPAGIAEAPAPNVVQPSHESLSQLQQW